MKTIQKKAEGEHTHSIALDEKGRRIMNDNGYYVCECGATTFPNCDWFEKPNRDITAEEPTTCKEWAKPVSKTRLYNIFQKMRRRCSANAVGKSRSNYFDRGIRMEWVDFYDFRDDMGESYNEAVIEYGEKVVQMKGIAKMLHKIASQIENSLDRTELERNNQLQLEKVEIEVNDTYEAAYYMISGGTVKSIRKRAVAENRVTKLGYREQWYITLQGVRKSSIYIWENGEPKANVKKIAIERKRIKKMVKKV